MFNTTTSNLVENKEAIRQDMICLLSSEKRSLFGDPYFGCALKKYMFEQATSVIADLLIDEVYSAIITFMPQVLIRRKDIKVEIFRNQLFLTVSYSFIYDKTPDSLTIKLIDDVEEDM
jgi:phage baseplate assembly protein W